MTLRRIAFSTVVTAALAASLAMLVAAAPVTASNSPKLNEVFKSLKQSGRGGGVTVRWTPLLAMAAAVGLMTVAIKQWNRRRATPRPVDDHRKLLREAARAAGVSRRRLRQVAPMARAAGLSSPLVAILCPSTIAKLARNARTVDERDALEGLAHGVRRAEAGR